MGKPTAANQRYEFDEKVRLRHGLGQSKRLIARNMGVSFGVVDRAFSRLRIGRPRLPMGGAEHPVERSESGNVATVAFVSDKPIRTLDEAIAYAEVDLSVWRVKKWDCGGWQVGMKVASREGKHITGETPVAKQLWRVKLELERILPRTLHDSLDGLFARLESSPRLYVPPKLEGPKGDHLMVVDLVDAHFGKLAWAPETGQNDDLNIKSEVYRDGVKTLLTRAKGYDIEEFLVPIGSDFLHVDNSGGTTTAGTPQDVDGRLAKILEVAETAVVWAVEEMAARGRVRVVWVPGNHDRLLSYCVARTLSAWFRKTPRVTVDIEPTSRKYHLYYKTLIGLTHGDQEKHAQLPGVMAQEVPQSWAETWCREWHVGHLHKSKQLSYLPLDTHNGVPVRTLRSLSAVDAWHYRAGYVGTQRSAEAFVYDREGWVAHFVADVKPKHMGRNRRAA